MKELPGLQTEHLNPITEQIDKMDTFNMVKVFNEMDREIPDKIADELASISDAVEKVVRHLKRGGRLIYVGAGTSGRLAMLDASECPPTFGVSPEMIQAVMAGGATAFNSAMENAEDDKEMAVKDLQHIHLTEKDVVMAITASGRTPYCISALKYASKVGAGCISLSCNKKAVISEYAEMAIEVDTGPEAILGSTRLKAGTAQKLVLNMISTGAMIKVGKVYKNLMVDMKQSNSKLKDRAKRMVMLATGLREAEAEERLQQAKGNTKTAIVMEVAGASAVEAQEALDQHEGLVRKAIESLEENMAADNHSTIGNETL